jgi:hypothetical protein
MKGRTRLCVKLFEKDKEALGTKGKRAKREVYLDMEIFHSKEFKREEKRQGTVEGSLSKFVTFCTESSA